MTRQQIHVVKSPDKLGSGYEYALSEFKKIGISQAAVKAPDLTALEKLMAKSTPPTQAEFLLEFDGKTLHFFVRVGTKPTTISKLDFAAAGSPGVKRAILQKLEKNSAVVTRDDLAAFDKKHPPPPSVEEQKKLSQALTPLRMQHRDKSAALKKLQDELKALDEQMKPLLAKEKEFKARWDAN
jgi:hypothetical protein